MSNPYVGEIRMFAGTFAPAGWVDCNGQLLPISDNEALFSLLGTVYGGDGQSTFGVPDLRGRTPMHMGAGPGLSARTIGESGGAETVTLTVSALPAHGHQPAAATASGTADSPAGGYWATMPDTPYAAAPVSRVPMHGSALTPAGAGQPHENRPPYQTIRFILSLNGIFPSPSA
ncbi:phage tail protein [Dactylosporangium matsuzakiense]|uniref:Tail Collar domain-containing protein n=1 Tax=Dactylosporangium matsuzakiense TaxID=53360 RepID=A0A9W6KGR4_9ACTN|nr:tail fiber protein [Dactylosporangium matsuzakiense]UWZ42492.1 phage tail protein [Dactylosporangium matsuzakiense]GLL00592.1 tail Collar domain-containing protein [Dactylosporangium matsuzakiense]